MSLPVAILAGGLATRLYPITKSTPKALVDIGGEPFIIRQLHYLRQQGISKVVLCIGHLGQQIEAVVGNGAAFGLDVCYSWDGASLLGTGGALKKALPLLNEEFFVFYGDSYLPINFAIVEKAYVESKKRALITVLKNNNQWDKSNVLFSGNSVIEYNKHQPNQEMKHIDYGLGILSSSIFRHFAGDNKPFDLASLYHNLSIQQELAGFEVYERFYEIGSHQGLNDLINYFKREANDDLCKATFK